MTTVKIRQRIEREIVRKVIEDALACQFWLGIDNGDSVDETRYNDADACMEDMMATDEDRLYIYPNQHGAHIGWIYFVYGNDGYDVISDYTTNLSPLMDPIEAWIEQEYE